MVKERNTNIRTQKTQKRKCKEYKKRFKENLKIPPLFLVFLLRKFCVFCV